MADLHPRSCATFRRAANTYGSERRAAAVGRWRIGADHRRCDRLRQALAAAGLGMVLTSLAANFTSSMVYDLIKPDLDADEPRAARSPRACKQRDPRRPPAGGRGAGRRRAGCGACASRWHHAQSSSSCIERGMHDSGGALAAIAPRYTEALRSPPDDWQALQAELQQTISRVSQTMETAEGGVISGGQMRAERVGGPVEQVMRATGKWASDRQRPDDRRRCSYAARTPLPKLRRDSAS